MFLTETIINGPKKSTLPFDSVMPKCIRFKLYILRIAVIISFDSW